MSDENDDDVVDSIPIESTELLNIHEPEPAGRSFSIEELNRLGMPVPVADPDVLRAAYAFRQKMVAAILDREHDFLYTISYVEQNKTREKITTSYKDALKFSETYRVPYKAVPKKSGIAKLATAFNIEGRIVTQRGLPVDEKASYAYVEYEVVHKASGKKAVGIGWARGSERGYAMPEHHMIALADTRAWGRAILRICGFGEAGAEEIGSDVVPLPTVRIEMSARAALPAEVSVDVIDVRAVTETRVPVPVNAPSQSPTVQPAAAQPAATSAPQASVSAPVSVPSSVPLPTPGATTPTITEAQVGKLSGLLKEKLGSVDRAKAWLKTEVAVETTRLVREADYPNLLKKLEAMEVP